MSKIKHARFRYSKPIDRFEFWINSDFLEEDIDFININKIDSVVLSRFSGFTSKSLSFLANIPDVKYLTLTSDLVTDFAGLYSLKFLIELYVSDLPKKCILDFTCNEHLESLNIPSSNVFNIPNLKSIVLRKSLIKDFKFEQLNKLTGLSLIQCTGISDLNFLPSFLPINSIELSYIPKLVSLSGIQSFSKTLNELSISNCKNITDLDLIGYCTQLKKVIIENGGLLTSAKLFKKFNQLHHFVVMGKTHFKDSDITILQNKNIPHFYIGK